MKSVFPHIRLLHGAIAVVVLSCIVYALPAFQNQFVTIDDSTLIVRNGAIQRIAPFTIKYIFTSYDPELYIPLTLFTYQINHAMAGLQPWIYHVTNLLLHIFNALLVLVLIWRLTRNRFAAIACAVLFAIHPLHVEAVLWAAARKDVLSTLFFLLSILLALRYRETHAGRAYWWSIATFALGLLSKVSIIMLPAILVLIDLRNRRKITIKNAVVEYVPYVVLAVVFGIIAIFGKTSNLASSGFSLNVLLGAKSTMFYLAKLFWPTGLTIIYPQSLPVTVMSAEFGGALIGVLLLGLIGLGLFFFHPRLRDVGFGILFFLILLPPNYTNFLKNGFLFFASDRYAYAASIGVFLAVASLILVLRKSDEEAPAWAWPALGVVTILLAIVSLRQGATWKDSEALFRRVLALSPESVMAHNNLGDALVKLGQNDDAEAEFREALRLDPMMMSAHVNLGSVLEQQGKFDEAEVEYRAAAAVVDAKPVPAVDDIGVYYYLGELLEKRGKAAESLAQFRKAAERGGRYSEPHYNLGLKLQLAGLSDEAIAEFASAIAIDPLYIPARYHLAGLLAERGLIDEAVEQLREVVRVNPDYEKAWEHLRQMEQIID